MLSLGQMCFAGTRTVAKGVWSVFTRSNVFGGHGDSCKGGLRCWHWVKYVMRAWGQLQTGFEVLAPAEMCFEGMGAVGKGLRGVGSR